MNNPKTPPVEDLLKILDNTIFRYKFLAVFFGFMTLFIFGIYYYIHANALSYALSGGLYIWILYTIIMRLSELRLLRMEVEILIEEHNKIIQKEARASQRDS